MGKRVKMFFAVMVTMIMIAVPTNGEVVANEYEKDINIEEYLISPRAVIPYCFCTGAPARMNFVAACGGYCNSCGTISKPQPTTALVYECTICHSQQYLDEFGHALVGVGELPGGGGRPLEVDEFE